MTATCFWPAIFFFWLAWQEEERAARWADERPIWNCNLARHRIVCRNKNKNRGTFTDVADVLPSSATECKHSCDCWCRVSTHCVFCFSGASRGVACVNSGIRGAPVLEIAYTFDLFTEHTFPWKLSKSTCGPELMYSSEQAHGGESQLRHVCKLAAEKQSCVCAQSWGCAVTNTGFQKKPCRTYAPYPCHPLVLSAPDRVHTPQV